jgi:integrase
MRSEKLTPTVEAIDRKAAGRYVTHLGKAGLDRKTVQRKVSACRSYWTWLGRKGHVPDDDRTPWDRQAPPKAAASGHDEDDKRPFTDAEVVSLLNGQADPEIADLMRVAALSGMRLEEVYRLRVRDCEGGVFNIRIAKTKAGKRKVPIHPDLTAIVARRVKGKEPTGYVFHEPDALAVKWERSMAVSKRFGRYRQTVGVHDRPGDKESSLVDFHSFRRWFITDAIHRGQPEYVVRQVVGHALQGVTMGVYLGKALPPRLRECVEAVRLPAGVRASHDAT